jgi:transposase InsO family protein
MSHLTLTDARRVVANCVSPRKPRRSRPRQVCLDRAVMDILVRSDDGTLVRPWVTLLMNVRTEELIATDVSAKPDLDAVLRCLKEAMVSPSGSTRSTLVVDDGREFHSSGFLDTCKELGIQVSFVPHHQSRQKPKLERFFSQLARELSQGDLFPGEANAASVAS